jgi:hypothetical protein
MAGRLGNAIFPDRPRELVPPRVGLRLQALGLDAHESEPTCTESSGPTECAGMIRCDMREQGRKRNCLADLTRAGFFILFQVPFFGSTRAASILPSRPPNLAAAARRGQNPAPHKQHEAGEA